MDLARFVFVGVLALLTYMGLAATVDLGELEDRARGSLEAAQWCMKACDRACPARGPADKRIGGRWDKCTRACMLAGGKVAERIDDTGAPVCEMSI